MNADQFVVFEHLSYDMVATWVVTIKDCRISFDETNRLFDSMEFCISPLNCHVYLFPDFELFSNLEQKVNADE